MKFVNRLAVAVAAFVVPGYSHAADMRGVTATEIRIGQTMPYSGPVSAFGALGKGEVGYFKMVNERGGINGRKVRRAGIRRLAIYDVGSLACTSLNVISRPLAR